jgi:hypothetical protein
MIEELMTAFVEEIEAGDIQDAETAVLRAVELAWDAGVTPHSELYGAAMQALCDLTNDYFPANEWEDFDDDDEYTEAVA